MIMHERKRTVRTRKRSQPEPSELDDLTPGERMGLVYQITVDAWSMTKDFDAESRLRRDVVRLVRRGS